MDGIALGQRFLAAIEEFAGLEDFDGHCRDSRLK
jgi:hypothetical protein